MAGSGNQVFHPRQVRFGLPLGFFLPLKSRPDTDLDSLTADLLRSVQETMQPEGMKLWLKSSSGR